MRRTLRLFFLLFVFTWSGFASAQVEIAFYSKDTGSTFPHGRLTVERARWHQQTLLLTFAELADRTAAETARGVVLHATIGADETPEDPEEFYDHQLVGLTAVDLDGTVLGTVESVLHGGAQDLLVVRTPDRREGLVPFVSALVPEVDLAGSRVVIADRPGLVTPLPDDES